MSQGDFSALLDDLKLYLGIEDTASDAELTRALDLAGQVVEVYLDTIVAKRPVSEWFAHHFDTVTLQNLPVDTAEPLVVTLDGAAQADYSIWLDAGQLGHLSRTGCPRDVPMDWRNYSLVLVTYTAGYDPIPSDLAQGIVYVAAGLYGSEGTGAEPGGGGSGAIKSMSIHDVGSIAYDVGSSGGGAVGVIPGTSVEMLRPYRRMGA